ncbi:MAG: hypothetical protein DHS20C15_12850 [Planctomycetota bacterium]|nr:MAG: hypothetical protein DHS20C15_12850 [Planctomycetota bacterium]
MHRPRSLDLCLTLFALTWLVAPARSQESAALFDAPVVVTDPLSRFDLVLDLDADGYADAVEWWWSSADSSESVRVSGWLNDQSGKLTKTWTSMLAMPEPDLAFVGGSGVGNFDGDARDDFALTFGKHVFVFSSNGSAPPTQLLGLTRPDTIQSTLVADFDLDGLSDIAINTHKTVELHFNPSGGSGFALAGSFGIDGENKLWLSEVNGDDAPDLMNVDGPQVVFHEIVNGQRVSQFALDHELGGDSNLAPLLGDIDGDGDDDVVAFREGLYRVFRRSGPTTFNSELVRAGGPATMLADVDGDGDLDGACCAGGGGGDPGALKQSAMFEISLNDGTGNFAPGYGIVSLGTTSLGIAGVADLDHDGDTDLIAGRTVYYASENGLGTPRHVELNHQLFYAHDVVDPDGDGDTDLNFGEVTYLANQGEGAFTSRSTDIATPPVGVKWRGPGYPGDFDGDGDVDLLLSKWTGQFTFPVFLGMRLLVNNGAGMLFDAGDAAAPEVFMNVSGLTDWDDNPDDSVIADVDGDGDVDLICRSLELMTSRVFLNDGAGFFVEGVEFPLAAVRHVADLNGDAHPDLVVSSTQLGVRFGRGGGEFSAVTWLPASQTEFEDLTDCGDLDSDGDVDIALVDSASNTITLHHNNGAGNFTTDTTSLAAYTTDDTSPSLRRALILDVDLDGRNDLLVTSPTDASPASYIFRQLPDGTLDAPLIQVVRPTAFGDVDGDGDLDLLSDRFSFNELLPTLPSRVIDNRAFENPDSGRVLQFGSSKPGTAGQAPLLGASGPLRVGDVVTIHLTGVQAGQLGVVSVGLNQTDLPNTPWFNVTAYTWPWLAFKLLPAPGSGQLPGDAGLQLSYVVDPSFPAVGPIYLQAIFDDPEAIAGRTYSNGLMLEHE